VRDNNGVRGSSLHLLGGDLILNLQDYENSRSGGNGDW
jgi:hypothetical protein